MKTLFLISNAILLFCAVACTKMPLNDPQPTDATKSTLLADADVVFHYQGMAYPLYFQDDSETDFVEDEHFLALQAATGEQPIVTFSYSDYPEHHAFLFDKEFDGYDYMEQHIDALLGRKFKLAHRIDQLRDQLMATYGELDFDHPAVEAAARAGVEAIYQELHITLPFPRDLAGYIGVTTPEFANNSNGRHHEVLTVWEHDNFQGQSLNVENAPHTVIWNYGDWNCFTMAANPDLTIVNKPDGSNWSDCISSQCLSYIDGADAMAVGYYKDTHCAVYGCGKEIVVYYNNGIGTNIYPPCFNMRDWRWHAWHGWCGHMNDQISSIRIKAIWQGCYDNDSVFDDLNNL